MAETGILMKMDSGSAITITPTHTHSGVRWMATGIISMKRDILFIMSGETVTG